MEDNNNKYPVPKHLLRGLDEVDNNEIIAWWNTLSDLKKEQMTVLCNRRIDSCLFGILDPIDAPEVERGHFLPDADDASEEDQWNQDHFDFLVNHPEIVIMWDPNSKKFHVGCVAHDEAHKCWARGSASGNFCCPFERTDCLMNPFKGRAFSVLLTTQLRIDRE